MAETTSNKELINYLQRYNDWRRGIDDRTMGEAELHPVEIGDAIDLAVIRLKHLDYLQECKKCNK